MKTVHLFKHTGDFAENKDIARQIRIDIIEPELSKGNIITIDFNRISSATQSFIHALISETIRVFGVGILSKLLFKNCNSKVKTIIEIVVEYVQDGMSTESDHELNRVQRSKIKKK